MHIFYCILLAIVVVFCVVKVIHVSHYVKRKGPPGYLTGNILMLIIGVAFALYLSHLVF